MFFELRNVKKADFKTRLKQPQFSAVVLFSQFWDKVNANKWKQKNKRQSSDEVSENRRKIVGNVAVNGTRQGSEESEEQFQVSEINLYLHSSVHKEHLKSGSNLFHIGSGNDENGSFLFDEEILFQFG